MTNDKFRQDVKNIINKGNNRQNQFVRKLCLELDRSIVLKSPVDTGRFRANWNIGFGSPNTSTTTNTDASGSSAIAKAQAELTGNLSGKKIFVTNSLPYAFRLEYEGWSNQAPQGMVRITIAELNTTIQKVGAEVKVL